MSIHLSESDLDRLLAAAAPQTEDYSPGDSDFARILGEDRPVRARRTVIRRRWSLRFALAPGALAAIGVALLLLVAGQQTGTHTEVASAAATLNRAADARQATPEPRPGELLYRREIENLGDGLFTVETWTRTDGSTARRAVTDRRGTRETSLPPNAEGRLPWIGLSDDEITALPTDPQELVRRVRAAMNRPRRITSISVDGKPAATRMATVPFSQQQFFGALMALYDVDLPLTNDQRAALLRGAATIPGVRNLGRVTDPLGRPADALAIAGDPAREDYGRAYLLSPTTGRLIATLELRQDQVHGWYARQHATTTSTHERPVAQPTNLRPTRYAFNSSDE